MTGTDMEQLNREICGAVWTSPHPGRLMEALSYDIGPRPTGSKAMTQAQELVATVLRELGANNVRTELVDVVAWREAPSAVEIVSPIKHRIESYHHVRSLGETVSGPILHVGGGDENDLERVGKQLEGAIVLIQGHEPVGSKFTPLPVRLGEFVEAGAAGVITTCVDPLGCPAIELFGTSDDFPVPAVGISYEEGHRLAALTRDGKPQGRLEASGTSYHTTCVNLVADLGPVGMTKECIVLSAHVDSFYVNPGSFDNLTGVITLIEIARALAPLQSKFQRTLRLVLYTGEEYGFQGSKAYIQQHRDELDRTRFVFNMDSLFPPTAEGVAVMWSPTMRDYIDCAFSDTQCQVEVRDLFCMSSDYLPFMLEGIPTARPAQFDSTQAFPPWSHTRLDTPDKVPDIWIRQNALTFAQMLARMLTDPAPLPAHRKSPQEVNELIDKEGACEILRSYGFDV